MPNILGLAGAAPLTGCQRKAGCRRAARARFDTTMGEDRSSASVGAEFDVGLGTLLGTFLTTAALWCGKMLALMVVLHITYKRHRETSNGDYDAFYRSITSYRSRRLSTSHWTIHTEEPPEAVWQKLKCHIHANDYLLMLPLDPSGFSPKDQTLLSWLAAGP